MVPLNFQNDHRIGSFQILKRFLINFLHRKVSDKFKDIQKIGSDTKTIKGEVDLEKVEEKVEEKSAVFDNEEIFPSLSSILTPEAVTGSEVKQQKSFHLYFNDS